MHIDVMILVYMNRLKKMNVKLDGDGDLYKNIAVVALEVQNDS